jgi:hypothetical protein
MSITYTYEIISVDQAARCMEVVYTSERNPTMHIGARLPYEGETVEAVVEMYAPLRYWEEQKTPTVAVSIGQSGTISPSTVDPRTAAANAVHSRNVLLANSDWTQLPDVTLTAEQKAEWAAYRQALRDVPAQAGFPVTINWPVIPGISVSAL